MKYLEKLKVNENFIGTAEGLTTSNTFTFHPQPEPVGFWQIGPGSIGTRFAVYEKPTLFQIKNTEELLGWKWLENEHYKENTK